MVPEQERAAWLTKGPHATTAWLRIIQFRLGASVALPVIIFSVPMLGPSRFLLAGVVGTTAGLGNLALWFNLRRDILPGSLMAAIDTLLTVLVVAFVPLAYDSGAILIACLTALYIFWIGRRMTAVVTGMAVAAMFVIGLWRQPDNWIIGFLILVICSTMLNLIISSIATAFSEASQRFNGIVNGIDAVVWEAGGTDGEIRYLNEQVFDVLGVTQQECLAHGFLANRVHPEDVDRFVQSRTEISNGIDSELQYRIRDLSGEIRFLHERISVSTNEDGQVSRRGVIVNETARHLAERSVRGYSHFIHGAPMAMGILRLDDLDDPLSIRILNGNPSAAEVLGVTIEEVTGSKLADVMHASPALLDRLANVVLFNASLEVPHLSLSDDGRLYALRAIPLPDQCIGVTLDDVTKAARASETLRHQALHDHLTGLPNRARFTQRLEHALEQFNSQVSDEQVAALMIDLNKFKDVNDSLGHEYGDKLLIELSRRLGRNIRGCDTIARLGGDEFAILIRSSDPAKFANDVAERIQQLIGDPFQIDGYVLRIGASIGVAVAGASGVDANARSLIRAADDAMYRAKAAGGGIVHHSSQTPEEGASRIGLAGDLNRALEAGQFEIHYQPRVDLRSLEPIGVEALVRWRHPSYGLLGPSEFIDIAEASGMIHPLTRIVIERAASDLVSLGLTERLRISVNISGVNLVDPMFIPVVEGILEMTGLPGDALCFELTENHLARDVGESLVALHRLRRLGICLSIDNFGSGFSSVPLIRELPIDELKIGRNFVEDLDGGDETLVRTMVNLGHDLGLHVVAGGVESSRTVGELQRIGCDSAQGFHFAKPMGIEALTDYLELFPMTPDGDQGVRRDR